MKKLLAIIVLLVAFPIMAQGTLEATWNPSMTATGYTAYIGPTSGNYDDLIDVGNNTNLVMNGLTDCQAVYLAITASNGAGESGFSNEVTRSMPRTRLLPPPTVDLEQGQTYILALDGYNFAQGSILTDSSGLSWQIPVIEDCNNLTVEVAVPGTVPLGPVQVTYIRPDVTDTIVPAYFNVIEPMMDLSPVPPINLKRTQLPGTQ